MLSGIMGYHIEIEFTIIFTEQSDIHKINGGQLNCSVTILHLIQIYELMTLTAHIFEKELLVY